MAGRAALLMVALLLANALPAQPPILWRFTEDQTSPGCPSGLGWPTVEDPGGLAWNPQYSQGGSVTITWWQFDFGAPVMLWLSLDQSRGFYPPCMWVPPDVVLTGTTNSNGEVRFMWSVPVTAPLSIVPLGTTLLGALQAVEISTIPPTATSYAVNIESIR